MNRFVLLRHSTAKDQYHWDFLFEESGGCKTFSASQKPVDEVQRSGTLQSVVTPLSDHRLVYLDYEGPVSNNRGFVKRLDFGTYQTIAGTIHFQGRFYAGTIDLRDYVLVMKDRKNK